VIRRFMRKDAKMASKSALLLVAAALSGCAYQPGPDFEAGMAPVNVPVVSRADYVFDAAAPSGTLAPSEAARLDGWFRSLDLRYGDSIYVEGEAYSEGARSQIAGIASNYGMLLSNGAPVTAGAVAPGNVRVVVSRNVASVPNCPNWERKSQPNYNNRMMPNLGCAVNTNLAAMVANPEDLVHGQSGDSVSDVTTGTKAVSVYKSSEPTGTKGLKDISTKSGGSN
jgi:pilus assembly protein CpaD